MASCLPEFIEALTAKRAAMEELLTILEAEQRSIIDVDIANLEQLDQRKRELLFSMERTNAACRLLLRKSAEELQVPQAESLSPLMPKIASPLRERFRGLQSRILELGEALQRVIAFNRSLLEGSLQHVQESVEFLNALFTRRSTYGQAGGMVSSTNDVRLVCKEI
ncbi:MAG: flagellar protein FlgN [Geobacter sp.]|nr:flagellar protein FlgN [Geobacter sp.]